MAGALGNLLLNALQLLQGGATQAEVTELLTRGGATGAGATCPEPPELSEAQQEAADLRADLSLLDFDEHRSRDCACPEDLCVHVVALDHGD